MYFPYLRGKQYELLALRELLEQDIIDKMIVPIIEPVKSNFANLDRVVSKFIDKKLQFILIINPQCGDLVDQTLKIKNEFMNKKLGEYKKNYFIGYIISQKTKADELDNFLSAYKENQVFLIHYARFQNAADLNVVLSSHKNVSFNAIVEKQVGRDYKDKLIQKSKFVLLEDKFNRMKNNSEYGEVDFFSALYNTYSSLGFDGFGDYLTIGDEYSESGGPAYAVAIHLSESTKDNEIWIRHFVSDSNGTPVDPGGKFIEALNKLIKYINANSSKFKFSNACDEFRKLHKAQHFPGLGSVKKLSMQHHIQLISNLI